MGYNYEDYDRREFCSVCGRWVPSSQLTIPPGESVVSPRRFCQWFACQNALARITPPQEEPR